jgi:RNA polymerase sigma-70 factor, ECF subfamily
MATSDPKPRNEGEFVRLYTASSRRIYTYILTLLPNRADAEDVFQDVGTLLWEKFDEFTPGSQFGAWACRIAYFKALKYRARKASHTRLFKETAMETIYAEMEAMDDSLDTEYRALGECFAALPEPDRRLIEQRYGPSGSPREIAAVSGLPIKRVYKVLDRIRKALLGCVTRKLTEGSKA